MIAAVTQMDVLMRGTDVQAPQVLQMTVILAPGYLAGQAVESFKARLARGWLQVI